MAKKIVVLGGGYGGVLTAKKLAKKFKKDDSVEITLIDRNPYHTLLTELHEVAAGRVEEEAIRIDLKKIFAKRNVNVVLDEINDFDFDKQQLVSDTKTYDYDYLVIGSGSKPTFFGIPGVEEHAHTLWSYDDAVNLREHILKMFRLAAAENNPEKRKELLTFVVTGAGFTGIEMVGELAEWKPKLCDEFHIDPSEVDIYVVDVLPKILPILPDKLIRKSEKRLQKLGVKILTETGISALTENTVTLGDKGDLKTRTVVWAAGVEGADIIEKAEVEQFGRKRIVTNSKLQSQDRENVYVVGDNIFYVPEGEELPVPQMVENCEHSAPVVANNIHHAITGKGSYKDYKPAFHGMMVCIGGRYGVAYVGTHKKKYCMPSFLAMFIKHFINVVYLFQVCGWNRIYTYAKHEVFCVRDNRSFLGGHFSNMSPNFWKVPLRLFLGYSWLAEGIAKLPKIIADPTDIFLFPMPAVDGVTAATEAADAAAEAVQALYVPEFIYNISSWGMETFVQPIAPFVQAFMVCAEIALGVMLLLGLFTAIASVGTVGMSLMIWSSGMAAPELIWYFFAGIALIGGSGKSFGLDYYVMPFLKRHWKNVGFVRKWYIYND